jgi:DNA topoisomerase-3
MEQAGKWLVIAEKPSVAADITKALGGFEKKEGYFESQDYLVTWAVGHLLELLSPEDIDPKYKSWLLKDLPIIPAVFQYKPKDEQKERLKTIKDLVKNHELQGFINACDAGREGELIFREVYEFCASKKSIQRLWLQSMTLDSIRKEFRELKSGSDFDHLWDAARCRAESDWLIGMNATRAMTRRLKSRFEKGSWSVGRVQTPTLALLVKREMDILKHRPEPFWTVEGRFSTPTHEYSAQWFDPDFKKTQAAEEEESAAVREKEDRIFSHAKLESIVSELNTHKNLSAAKETRKESKETAPQLFDLTMLQREANRRYGMSASRTLQAAQRLYEKHKLLTYPRTDSKFLPEDYVEVCDNIFKRYSESASEFSKFCTRIIKNGMLNKDRIFNNKMVSDHFAIIPTGEVPDKPLEGDDQRIYELVIRRFLAAFMPPAVWAKVERITKIKSHHFRTRVQDLTTPGWREVYGLDTDEESRLPKLDGVGADGSAAVKTEEIIPQEHATKPAPRITEAKLLSLMENAGRSVSDEEIADALKEKGIGTPATRAEVIENLIGKSYVMRTGKALKPVAKGIRLVDVLCRIPVDVLASVELTGEMEFDLKRMEKGEKTRAEFMQNMTNFTTDVVEKARSFDYDGIYANELPLGTCPQCKNGKIIESFWVYKCTDNPTCEFVIWKEKNQRYVDRSLVADVLAKGVCGPFEFMTSGGTPFEAWVGPGGRGLLLHDAEGKPMEQSGTAEMSIIHEEVLPTTFFNVPARVVETETAFICEFGVLDPAAEAVVEEKPKKAASRKKAAAAAAETEDSAAAKKTAKSRAKSKGPRKVTARMPKILCGRPMSIDDFKLYVTTGATPAITDFKSKKGRPFAAILQIKANGNFEFKFQSRKKLVAEAAGEEGQTPPEKKPARKTTSKAKVVKKTAETSTVESKV